MTISSFLVVQIMVAVEVDREEILKTLIKVVTNLRQVEKVETIKVEVVVMISTAMATEKEGVEEGISIIRKEAAKIQTTMEVNRLYMRIKLMNLSLHPE